MDPSSQALTTFSCCLVGTSHGDFVQNAKSSILMLGSECHPLTCLFFTSCACVLSGVWGWGKQGLGCGQCGRCQSISDDHLCCIPVSACLPQVGGFISQNFFMYCYLLVHPLCALSASESLGCSQAAVLRDLKRDLVGLGAECHPRYSPKKDLVSILIQECCLHVLGKIS